MIGKPTSKEDCEEKANDYADIVARSGVGVTYEEAFSYYMDKYLPTKNELAINKIAEQVFGKATRLNGTKR